VDPYEEERDAKYQKIEVSTPIQHPFHCGQSSNQKVRDADAKRSVAWREESRSAAVGRRFDVKESHEVRLLECGEGLGRLEMREEVGLEIDKKQQDTRFEGRLATSG
jgi:hypothetical protein